MRLPRGGHVDTYLQVQEAGGHFTRSHLTKTLHAIYYIHSYNKI
jgi:hypothetical protein